MSLVIVVTRAACGPVDTAVSGLSDGINIRIIWTELKTLTHVYVYVYVYVYMHVHGWGGISYTVGGAVAPPTLASTTPTSWLGTRVVLDSLFRADSTLTHMTIQVTELRLNSNPKFVNLTQLRLDSKPKFTNLTQL